MARKILAIDDHPDTIQLIELSLKRHGYEVFGAYSGPEGLEIAEKERPDLILLDMMMPGMDGNAVCRAIRQNPELASTPVIMFTAKSQAVDKKDSFDAGADDYVTKPTRPADLLQRIELLLARQENKAPADEESAPPVAEAPGAQRFITVLGSRGGAGATTVALNIAATIAGDDIDAILVDLDTQQGHAALYVGVSPHTSVTEWLEQPVGTLSETLFDYLIEVEKHLHLLASRLDLSRDPAPMSASQMTALASTLQQTGRTILVDLGPHRSAAVTPVLKQSDKVIICLRAERAAILGARQLLEQLQSVVGPDKLHLIMLDYGEGETISRPAVESFLGRPLHDVIYLDPKALTNAVGRHQPLVHVAEDGQPLRQFRRLVRQLVPAA